MPDATPASPPGSLDEMLRMAPFDDHNQELIANVRPPDWTNPEPDGRYNLVAIGAGTAGLVSAAGAAGLGARAAVIASSTDHRIFASTISGISGPSSLRIAVTRSTSSASCGRPTFILIARKPESSRPRVRSNSSSMGSSRSMPPA